MTVDHALEDQVEQILKKIQYYFDIQRYENVIEEANQLFRIEPDHSYALYLCGWSNFYLYRYHDALECGLQLLKQDPNDPDYYHLCGVIYRELEDFQQAIFHSQKALELGPETATFYYGHALNLIMAIENKYGSSPFKGVYRYSFIPEYKEQLENSIGLLQQGIKLDPELVKLYDLLAYVYRQFGLYDESEEAYRTVLEMDAQRPSTYAGYAKLQYCIGRLDEAKRLLDLALMFDAENDEAVEFLPILDKCNDQSYYLKMMKKHHSIMVQLYPNSRSHHLRLIRILLQLSDRSPIKELKKYVTLHPSDLEMNLTYGKLLYEHKDYQKAWNHFLKCQKLFPDNPHIEAWLSKVSELGFGKRMMYEWSFKLGRLLNFIVIILPFALCYALYLMVKEILLFIPSRLKKLKS